MDYMDYLVFGAFLAAIALGLVVTWLSTRNLKDPTEREGGAE